MRGGRVSQIKVVEKCQPNNLMILNYCVLSVDTLITLYNIIFFISGMIFCINSFLPFLWLFVEQFQMLVPMAGLLPQCTSLAGETNQKSWIQTTAKWSSHLISSQIQTSDCVLAMMDYICNKIKISSLHNWWDFCIHRRLQMLFSHKQQLFLSCQL